MRCSPLLYALAVSSLFCLPESASAQLDPLAAELACARRELVAAKIEARHYWQVEYQRERRALNSAIEFTEAEVRTLRRRLRDYGPFTLFSTGQPLLVTYQDAKLCLLDAELRLRALVDERNNLVRFHSDKLALLELRVAEARDRVIALEGGGIIELEVIE